MNLKWSLTEACIIWIITVINGVKEKHLTAINGGGWVITERRAKKNIPNVQKGSIFYFLSEKFAYVECFLYLCKRFGSFR